MNYPEQEKDEFAVSKYYKHALPFDNGKFIIVCAIALGVALAYFRPKTEDILIGGFFFVTLMLVGIEARLHELCIRARRRNELLWRIRTLTLLKGTNHELVDPARRIDEFP